MAAPGYSAAPIGGGRHATTARKRRVFMYIGGGLVGLVVLIVILVLIF